MDRSEAKQLTKLWPSQTESREINNLKLRTVGLLREYVGWWRNALRAPMHSSVQECDWASHNIYRVDFGLTRSNFSSLDSQSISSRRRTTSLVSFSLLSRGVGCTAVAWIILAAALVMGSQGCGNNSWLSKIGTGYRLAFKHVKWQPFKKPHYHINNKSVWKSQYQLGHWHNELTTSQGGHSNFFWWVCAAGVSKSRV